MVSVWDGFHNRKAQEYGADRQLEGATIGLLGTLGQSLSDMAGKAGTSMGNVAQAEMGGYGNAFDRYASGVGGMTGDYMRGTGANYKTYTDGTNRYQDNLADLGRTNAGMFRDYSTNLSNMYGHQTAENANAYNAYTQPFMAGLTAAGNIGSAGLGATGAAANAALGSNASMNQAFQNMLGMNSQGANNAYGTIGASRNQGAANIAQAMGGVGQEALRARGQMLTGAGGALEGMTRGIADMRSNIGSNTALANANLGGALASATGTIAAGASPFTVVESQDRLRQNNAGSTQSSGETNRETDSTTIRGGNTNRGGTTTRSGTTIRGGTDIDLDGLFGGLFGAGGSQGGGGSTNYSVTGPGGQSLGSGGFSSGTTGLPGSMQAGLDGSTTSTTRKFNNQDTFGNTDIFNQSDSFSNQDILNERMTNRNSNQSSFDTGMERESSRRGPSPLLGRIVNDAFGNLQGIGATGFGGIERSQEMADDMSPFDRGYAGIDQVMQQADDQSMANAAYRQLGGALNTLYDNPANDYVAKTFDQTRLDGGNYLTRGMQDNRAIYNQTLGDINNQVRGGYSNLNGMLSGVQGPTSTDPSAYLSSMDSKYADGTARLGDLQSEMSNRQDTLIPMYVDSNERMGGVYDAGLRNLGSGYNTTRGDIGNSATTGRTNINQTLASGQHHIQNVINTAKEGGFLRSPEQRAMDAGAAGYYNRIGRQQGKDAYTKFMKRIPAPVPLYK
jgi:hypothetical protein